MAQWNGSLKEFLQDGMNEVSSTAAAQVRQGAKEIAQVLPAFPDSIRPVEEPGMPGNLTPREVYEVKHPEPTKEAPKEPEMERD